jgi:hypothetical protein
MVCRIPEAIYALQKPLTGRPIELLTWTSKLLVRRLVLDASLFSVGICINMLSRSTTGVLTFPNFFVGTPLIIATFLIIYTFLIVAPLLFVAPLLIIRMSLLVGPLLIVHPALIRVTARISGCAWLSLWTRWSLRWGCGAPSNK